MENFKYKRILLKISGEALGSTDDLYSNEKIDKICQQIKTLINSKVQVALVVGGGNIWRGAKEGQKVGLDRTNADYMGMLATVMNALVLESKFRALGLNVIVQSALEVNKVAEPYYYKKAISRLEKGYVVILAGGTGYPYFTTDTTAALRAAEIKADVILMAKNGVDGVYDQDPQVNKNAVRFSSLDYQDITSKNLKVMDLTASTMSMEADLEIVVFDINTPDNIIKAAQGTAISTTISSKKNINSKE
ncbi:UMP kinase [Spiroplasma platyhelix]|uniref:Uridylate kinase n=1 Tax=Spiroplasma platyhelix PALS-1 TaxID=1276218 RepID=A0A846TTD0_9MOLU|nr:UMP kinase [Spiroplasma platyhelix]MBE4704393.1 Uridylate kinase [Spiroplasma platyhelix PALS-1]NKE38765.1 UMP kinase [Spiroplasma platyhelix PALS-1]UJB28976.1 uridylate kinase [Spiroplasma platyhelix PALS-1]